MSSNESAWAKARPRRAYRGLAGELHRYPDGGATKLRQAIAASIDVDPDQIICGAGSDDVLVMLMRAYAGCRRRGALFAPRLPGLCLAAQSVGAQRRWRRRRRIAHRCRRAAAGGDAEDPHLLRGQAQQPDRQLYRPAEIARLRRGLPENVLLVLDAAYAGMSTGRTTNPASRSGEEPRQRGDDADLLEDHGSPALRLGWGYCPKPGDRCPEPHPRPVHTRRRRRRRALRPGGSRPCRPVEGYNDHWLPWFGDRVTEIGPLAHPSVANFLLVQFPKEPKLSADAADGVLKSRRVPGAQDGRLRPRRCLRSHHRRGRPLRPAPTPLGDFVQKAATNERSLFQQAT